MHSEHPESFPPRSWPGGSASAHVEVGCSLDYSLMERSQCQCSIALKDRFKDYFYDSPARLVAIPGPRRQLIALKEHNPYVGQILERLNANPVNTLNVHEWLSDSSGQLTQLIQPVNCTYRNARVYLSFPTPLWRAGLLPGPASIIEPAEEEKRTVVLVAGAGFLEVWRYSVWYASVFNDLVPRFWQDLLRNES